MSEKTAQPTKVVFNFDRAVPNKINAYVLELTHKLGSKSTDGQRHFVLV